MGTDCICYLEHQVNGSYWFIQELPLERNGFLFGVLAGVENTTFKPIAEQRGIPNDLSLEIRNSEYKIEVLEKGHHSSYLTLKEILDYPWDEPVKRNGFVTVRGLLSNQASPPFQYGVLRQSYTMTTEQKVKKTVALYKFLCDLDYGYKADEFLNKNDYAYPTHSWVKPVELTGNFLSTVKTLNKMYENARLVFGFG